MLNDAKPRKRDCVSDENWFIALMVVNAVVVVRLDLML